MSRATDSTDFARPFLSALREVDGSLLVPLPERVRILRELESDLEDLRGQLEVRGVPSSEARSRAVEMLVPDRVTLGELRGIYASKYVRLTGRMSPDLVRALERSALAAWAASVLLVQAMVMLRTNMLGRASIFVWPVMALGALTAAAACAKMFELWIARDHGAPERGLGALLALSAATLSAGLLGVVADLFRLATTLERAPELEDVLLTEWVIRSCLLLAFAMLLALAGALAWFVIRQWLALVWGARLEVLGLSHPNPRS